MSTHDDLQRELTAWMADEALGTADEAAFAPIVIATGRRRPRPRWLALMKEPPMRLSNQLAVGSPMARLTATAATGVALAVLLAGAVIAATPSRSEVPVGASPMPSASGAASASPTATDVPLSGMVTEEVGPGVVRIVNDGAGHDLGDHPRPYPDGIAVAGDGTIWVISADYGSDPDHPENERFVWALGRPGMTKGVPFGDLVPLPDGSLLIVGESVVRFDGETFRPDDGPRQRPLGGGATLWLLEPEDLMGLVDEPGSVELAEGARLAMVSRRDTWRSLGDFAHGTDTIDVESCFGVDDGVVCFDGLNGLESRYLEGTSMREVAVTADGTMWAVGDYGGDPGGLYHITPAR